MSSTFFAFSLSSDTTAFQYRRMAREYCRDLILIDIQRGCGPWYIFLLPPFESGSVWRRQGGESL